MTENNAIVNNFNDNFISGNVSDGLKVECQRTPRLYIQPNIHKEENSGRAVISSLNCHKSKVSEYVDFHLQPKLQHIPSYVKNVTDFLLNYIL